MEASNCLEPPAPIVDSASSAARNAHAPYSNFRVGASLRAVSGAVYIGCNVENASYGLTICAERNAIFAAVAAEGQGLAVEDIVVVSPDSSDCSPCGACRQVIAELASKATIWFQQGGEFVARSCDDLLPDRFG